MKELLISVVLILMILAMPTIALASEEVDIGIEAEGDVDVEVDIEAGGDVSLDAGIETKGDVDIGVDIEADGTVDVTIDGMDIREEIDSLYQGLSSVKAVDGSGGINTADWYRYWSREIVPYITALSALQAELELTRKEITRLRAEKERSDFLIQFLSDRMDLHSWMIREVIVYCNIFPRQFESVAAFEEWWEAQDFKLFFNGDPLRNDCDDYAEDLQVEALKQGYSISQALTQHGRYFG